MNPTPHCLACGGELLPAPSIRGEDLNDRVPGTWSVHSCRTCGSGTTLPFATEDELPSFYVDDYAPFRTSGGPTARARAYVQQLGDRRFPLAEARGDGPPGTLLDVGCGRGELSGAWHRDGWRALGIEPATRAAEAARSRGVEIVGSTVANAEVPPESVDAVVFSHSLEHVLDPRADLARVYTLLRPGGRVAVIAPNWGSWQRRAFGKHWFPLELPRHRTHFTATGLGAALAAAGFADIEIRPATPFITTTWSLQIRLFGRVLSRQGVALLGGYAACMVVAPAAAWMDRRRGGGDFLHAVATRSS